MFFTNEDYKRILKYLLSHAIKDSEFASTDMLLSGDYITLILNGMNVKILVLDFVNELKAIGVPDFLNVTYIKGGIPMSLSEAIEAVPQRSRRTGIIITFLNNTSGDNSDWSFYLFTGNEHLWNSTDRWKPLYFHGDGNGPNLLGDLNAVSRFEMVEDAENADALAHLIGTRLEFDFKLPRGEKGPKGDPGHSITFDELSIEQKEELKGEKGDAGIGEKLVIVFKLSDNTPDTPEGGSFINGLLDPPIGWNINVRRDSDSHVWISFATVNSENEIHSWSVPIKITGNNGYNGKDGESTVFIFCTNQDATRPPVLYLPSNRDSLPAGWTYEPTGVTEAVQYEWVSMRKKQQNSEGEWEWSKYSNPALWAVYAKDGKDGIKGLNGDNGDGLEYIYMLTNTYNAPSIDPYDNASVLAQTSGFKPTGWEDYPQQVSARYPYQWISQRRYLLQDDGIRRWGYYGIPVLWSYFGSNGEKGNSVKFLYTVTSKNASAPLIYDANASNPNQEGSIVWIETVSYDENTQTIWRIEGTVDANGKLIGRWEGPFRITGKDGNDGICPNYVIYVYKKQNSGVPSVPTGGVNNPGNGWQEFPDSDGIWYLCVGSVNGLTGSVSWGAVLPLNGKDGVALDGKYTELRFTVTDTNSTVPYIQLVRTPLGWTLNPPNKASNQYLWMTKAIINPNNTIESIDGLLWSTPICISGVLGSSSFKSVVYKRGTLNSNGDSIAPATPIGGSYNSPLPSPLNGWSNTIPLSGDTPCYMSTRIFTSDGLAPLETTWTTPSLAYDAPNSVDTCYSSALTKPEPPVYIGGNTIQNDSVWHNECDSEHDIWMAIRTYSGGKWSDWSILRIRGENGAGLNIKNVAKGHYVSFSAFNLDKATIPNGIYLIDDLTGSGKTGVGTATKNNTQVVTTISAPGDAYKIGLDLWVASTTSWLNTGQYAGEDGVGIESMTVKWSLSNSQVSAVAGEWSDTVPVVDDNSRDYWIWVKYLVTFTDGRRIELGPYCTGKYSADVKYPVLKLIVYIYHYSDTIPPLTVREYEWSETPLSPTASNKYVWAKERILFSDGTYSAWSEPYFVSGRYDTSITIQEVRYGIGTFSSPPTVNRTSRLPGVGWVLANEFSTLGPISGDMCYWQIMSEITYADSEDDIGTLGSGGWSQPLCITPKNGVDGQDGSAAPIVYPQGEYDSTKVYTTSGNRRPYVYDALNGKYYVLMEGDWLPGAGYPSQDTSGQWLLMLDYKAFFTNIGIIENGLIGSAVFNGNYMFSLQGTTSNFLDFNPNDPMNSNNAFVPNVCINFKTGESWFGRGDLHTTTAGNLIIREEAIADSILNAITPTIETLDDIAFINSNNYNDFKYNNKFDIRKCGICTVFTAGFNIEGNHVLNFPISSDIPRNKLEVIGKSKLTAFSLLGKQLTIANYSLLEIELQGIWSKNDDEGYEYNSGDVVTLSPGWAAVIECILRDEASIQPIFVYKVNKQL